MINICNTMVSFPLLSAAIFLPVVGAMVVFVCSRCRAGATRGWALAFSFASLVCVIIAAWTFFSAPVENSAGLRLVERHAWIVGPEQGLHIQYLLGVDGISLSLLLLAAFITPLAVWSSFTAITERHREYYALLLLLQGAMQGVFCAQDLLLFYVFFEFTLIPLYFLIGIWGGPLREKAANMFFIYTLAGSMLTFAGVLYLGWKAATHLGVFTLELEQLYRLAAAGALSTTEQYWLFFAFFAGFAIKVPLFPLHTWLPLAHTEAPTAGSVVLAAILLKLGTYGFLRLSLPMLPDAAIAWAPFLSLLAITGIIYGAVAAWVQSDIKKLVAYSSVSHLGFCLLGMFSLKMAGLTGSLLYMINHGLSTGALFLVVGMIYERYHTRELADLGGLARKMPCLAFFLLVFTMSSIGLPGLNGFVSEFLVLLGTFTSASINADGPAGPLGPAYAIVAASGILLGAIYMLHMVKGILFGPLKEGHGFDRSCGLKPDLTRREVAILAPIAAACLFLGVYPRPVTKDLMEPALRQAVLIRVLPQREPGWDIIKTSGMNGDNTNPSRVAIGSPAPLDATNPRRAYRTDGRIPAPTHKGGAP